MMLKMRYFLLCSAALLVPAVVQAAESGYVSNEIELGYGHDSLDHGYDNWSSIYLDAEHRFEKRRAVYGEWRSTRRFGLSDHEVSAGYYHPFDATWTGHVEASTSPDHHVLPQDSIHGQLQKSFDGGWDVQAGLRRSRYTGVTADLKELGGERYWGDFRAAYTLYLSKLPDSGNASSHNLQLSYYYTGTGRDYLTLSVAHGRQVENVGAASSVLISDVTSTSLYGRHWLTPVWGLSYEATVEHQGSLYTRKGVRLGLRRAF